MCGIAGIHVKKHAIGRFPIDRLTDHLLLGIEPRGDHATGYLALSDVEGIEKKAFTLEKKDVAASEFIRGRKLIASDSTDVLMHTRWATKGDPKFNQNNHPVLFDTCFAIHNGHISNDDELFAEMGLDRPADVDSVAIPAVLKYNGMGNMDDIKAGLEQLEGGFAIAAVDPVAYPGKLVLAKGSASPLIVLNHKDCIVWASTLLALRDAWGAILGTPPSRKMSDTRPLGLHEFEYGEVWVVEGDEIEKDKFQPKVRYASSQRSSQTHGFQRYYSECIDDECEDVCGMYNYGGNRECFAGDYGDYYDRRPRVVAGTGGDLSVSRVRHSGKTWTCSPVSWECKHPCKAGCSTVVCDCWAGNPNHPKVDGKVLELPAATRAGGTLVGPASDRVTTKVEATCYICQEDEPIAHMDVIRCFDGYDALVCKPCGEESHSKIAGEPQQPSFLEALQKWELLAKKMDGQHHWAVKEVASELNTTNEFVRWIMFECPDELLEDRWLSDMKEAVAREFDNALKIVKQTRGLEDDGS